MDPEAATTALLALLACSPSLAKVLSLLGGGALAPLGARDVALLPHAEASGAPTAAAHRAVTGAQTVVAPGAGGVDVAVPLMSRGLVHGVLTFTSDADPRTDSHHLAFLSAVGAALGMWCDQPGSGMHTADDTSTSATRLTARQASILRLVEAGRSTDGIAAALKVSTATVKAELRRASQALGTVERADSARAARRLGLLDDEPVSQGTA